MAEQQECLKCGVTCSMNASGTCRECRRIDCKKCGIKFSPGAIRQHFGLCASCGATLRYASRIPALTESSADVP